MSWPGRASIPIWPGGVYRIPTGGSGLLLIKRSWTFLRLLSRFQLTGDQATVLLSRKTELPFDYRQMLADPYLAHILTVGSPAAVDLGAIDRGCFPKPAIRTSFPLAEPSVMRDAADRRRIRALVVEVWKRQQKEETPCCLLT